MERDFRWKQQKSRTETGGTDAETRRNENFGGALKSIVEDYRSLGFSAKKAAAKAICKLHLFAEIRDITLCDHAGTIYKRRKRGIN